MYLSQLAEERTERILNDVLADILHDEDWNDSFPSVLGYEVFAPGDIDDAVAQPNALYGDDHAIASVAVSYLSLHTLMKQIVEAVIFTNIHWKRRRNIEENTEQPGIYFARVLALHDIKYVKLYADFLLSLGDKYTEKYQSFDIVRIIKKWNWREETYFLLFVYWFLADRERSHVLEYLSQKELSLKDFLQKEEDVDVFFNSLAVFLSKAVSELTEFDSYKVSFNDLVEGFICPESEDEKLQYNNHFVQLFEALRNQQEGVNNTILEKISNNKTEINNIDDELPCI